MRVSAPVTDYIRASVINTKGDLVVRGDLVPELLRAGADGTFFRGKGAVELPAYEVLGGVLDTYLKAQGAAVNPIFEKLALRDTGVYMGTASRNTAGNQGITGVGYKPSTVDFIAVEAGVPTMPHSIGLDNQINHYCMSYTFAGISRRQNAYSIRIYRASAQDMRALIASMDIDGFTLIWSNTGTLFTVDFSYRCLP